MTQAIVLHGIPNCDQVRKAQRWLKDRGLGFAFRDLRTEPLSEHELLQWLKHLPHESLLNRRGTTWRALSPELKASVVDQGTALTLLLAHPLLIKRPVLAWKDQLAVGFSPDLYASLLPEHPPLKDQTS